MQILPGLNKATEILTYTHTHCLQPPVPSGGRGGLDPNPATQGTGLGGAHPGQGASPLQCTPSMTQTPDPPRSRARSIPLCHPPQLKLIFFKFRMKFPEAAALNAMLAHTRTRTPQGLSF
uniref:Uncharacterized protein n=1 Tax=Scleropages formosus TaxID=113540 RepID=A0A8C9SL93_SCLFO